MQLDPEALADLVIQTVETALSPVLERLAVAEARLALTLSYEQALGELRDRVLVGETKAAAIVPAVLPPAPPIDLAPVLERLAAVSERVAVVETRAPVPGPAGQDGAHGTDGMHGKDGKDGADGLGFEDLAVEFDGDRTIALRFDRAGVSKVFPLVLPFLRYQGVYQQAKAYTVGDTVTWGGALWHCQEATITKPGESAAWKLCVNRGRDGKAGKDGGDGTLGALPVVKVR